VPSILIFRQSGLYAVPAANALIFSVLAKSAATAQPHFFVNNQSEFTEQYKYSYITGIFLTYLVSLS